MRFVTLLQVASTVLAAAVPEQAQAPVPTSLRDVTQVLGANAEAASVETPAAGTIRHKKRTASWFCPRRYYDNDRYYNPVPYQDQPYYPVVVPQPQPQYPAYVPAAQPNPIVYTTVTLQEPQQPQYVYTTVNYPF